MQLHDPVIKPTAVQVRLVLNFLSYLKKLVCTIFGMRHSLEALFIDLFLHSALALELGLLEIACCLSSFLSPSVWSLNALDCYFLSC